MIANPSSLLNTATRGRAVAADQPVASAPGARSGAAATPPSTEFSRMLEHNQAAAREAQAATRARHAGQSAVAHPPSGQTTPPTSPVPASAGPREPAPTHQDQADASDANPAGAAGDAACSARELPARDKTVPARVAHDDTADLADTTVSPDASCAEAEDTAAPLPTAVAGMAVPNLSAVALPATVSARDASAPADDAVDVTPPGAATGKPGVREARSAARADVGIDNAVSGATAGKPGLREAGGAARADGVSPAVASMAVVSTGLPVEASTADPSAVPVKGGPERDLPMSLAPARELSEHPAPDAVLATVARSAQAEPTQHRASAGGDAASAAAFGISLAGVQAVRTGDVSAPAPVQASVPTPLTDPGFQQALGYQVSLLARDGIGQAELHLNPTDMGPVSVQITMTGDQARVDFGADLAQTRQLLEAGWAELASSLKDAGFTLSGGGVSDHARERQAQQGQANSQSFGGRPARESGEGPAVAPAVVRRVSGGVDVYA